MSISAGPLGLGVGPPLGPSGPLNGPPPSSDQLLLTLRNKPHCRVFRALFQYLPLRDSPNDNPQLELPLNPGDVILVKGEMDSDGFFRGETLDGRTGLVPSNYVERVPDHLILQNARAPSPSFPLSVPPHLTTIQHDFTTEPPDTSHLPDSVCPFPPADVSKVTVQEIKQNDSPRVPCPRDLVVEKKLSRSLVISWSPPEESFVVVSQYHVCVDSSVRAVVPGSYKCRALIEDVALDHSVNVSVRAVTDQGHSPDQSCSIAVGNEAQVAPQHLRVWQVTPVSACVRWHPSNSNAEHVVSLNAVKVGVCPPSVYQVQLSGLTPSTIYRISIRTKHPRAVLEQRPVERCLDFKTLPKIGLPDPPINVQVEHGPQPGHLLVSWTPVCSQPKPPSRAAVSGYLVYADGKNIAQVPSETVIADHAVLRLADLSDDPPIFITVRTKTKEGAVSADSNVARVPRGSYTEPLLTAAPLTLDPMASSYPSYAQPAYATPNPYIGPMSGPTAATVQPMPGFWNLNVPTMIPAEAVSNAPVAPYSAPTMMTAIPFQANPLTSYATANTIQGYSAAAPTYDGTLPRIGTLTRGAGLAAASTIPVQPALQTTSHTGTLQGTLPKWKTPQSMSQYYTFHPRLLRADGSAEDARPSVLEMENSYLLRHRQNEWTGPTADGRTRAEIYTRGGIRAGSAEERMPAAGGRGRLVPPRLARVRSETGFGTRSEPDLRPPTLDDDCRWFVALFDYSHHMSPNANAEQEELSFRKHQLIKVYGEADGDGFYQGQIGNRYGLVPSNMVIEIAKNDLLPPYKTTYNRGEPMLAAEPALRRMRWGSLKSRSYDHAGDRRREAERPGTMYSSLDRRDQERREPPQRDRYRRANGRDYDYRRDYDDRYREASRDRRDEYYPREEDDYREREKYRYESRDRRDERRDERRDDRRGEYEDRRRREDDRYRRDRRDEGYREDRSFDYADKTRTGYDQGPGRPASQLTHMPGQSGPSGYGQSQMPGQQMGMGHLTSQMSQMHLQQGMSMQQQMPMEARMNGLHAQQQPSKHMIAKFDYDSRQLSPNADAEQTELSFKQGDMIAIYGEMDEDGFYMGELNGLKGLVPSNFLSEEPLTHLLPAMPAEQIMQRKGVAFSDGQLTSQAIPTAAPVKKAPTRQSSQTSTTPATNNISAGKPTAKKSTAGQGTGAKTLAKKTSDVGKKGDGGPAVRKTSTAVKKSDSTAKGSPSDSSMSKLFLGVFFTATTLVTFYSLLQASLILSEIRSFHSEFLEHNDDYLTTSNKVWELMQKEIGITTISREKRGSESSCGCESCRSGVNKCPSGPPGPPGNPGQKGDDGQPGERGLNGKAGVITGMFDTPTGCIACPQGEPGIQGAPGPQGPPGRNGVNGYRGNAGRSGAPGQAGPRGDQGRPGRNGNPGQPGQPGENGQRGKGESGPPGPAGPSGEYGAPGSPGPNGIDAQPGMPGVAGPAGKPGVPGTDGTNGARGGNGAPGPDAAYCPCPVRNQVFVSPADKTQEEERKKAIRKGVVFN